MNGQSTLGFPVLRYAELLLIHAEADLLSDGTLSADGLNSLNTVRSRAGLPDLALGEVTIMTILEERRWELFLEAKRWFDFMRKRNSMPNLINEAFAQISEFDTDNNDMDLTAFTPERHWKLPYPQSAIDRNPNLTQKPVWAASE